MNIIHLTDLHIGHERSTKMVRNLIGTIRKTYSPTDHTIVISGDIGEIAGHRALALSVLAPLSAFRILMVPGNHDYGHSGMAMRWECVQGFDQDIYGGDGCFPKVTAIEDITFIGLDSMREKFFWEGPIDFDDDAQRLSKPKSSAEGLQGCIGRGQLAALKKALDDVPKGNKIVVFLHHDPIAGRISMELLDRHRLAPILKKAKVTALLCGHTHHFAIHDGKDMARCFNGGTSGARDGGMPDMRVINLDTSKVDEFQ